MNIERTTEELLADLRERAKLAALTFCHNRMHRLWWGELAKALDSVPLVKP